jgi:threonine aldolase
MYITAMKIIDLRSDTVTQPSPAMRRAIAEAVVGDDVFGDDPTVNRLERTVADLFGKEASLFVPSGTMGNQVALRTLSRPGWELICERECHIINYEVGGPAVHSSLMVNMLETEYGFITAEQIKNNIRDINIHCPLTKIVALENTHNRHGGTVYPLDEILKIRQVADKYKLLMHLDGARIWNAHVATGISLSDYVSAFDSVSVCLSKALGAPIGSMILGSKAFIEEARRNRKLFGGAMRQVGLLAAGALYAVEHNIERLVIDHENARLLAEGLNRIDGFKVDMARVQTNIVIAEVSNTGHSATEVVAKIQEAGVLTVPFGPTRVRLIPHLDITREDCQKAVERIGLVQF